MSESERENMMDALFPARADAEIRVDVQDELDWTSDIGCAAIRVAVTHGTVSLSGEVLGFAERLAAVRATLRVSGVRTIVDDLITHPSPFSSVTQADTAKEVEHALALVAFVR